MIVSITFATELCHVPDPELFHQEEATWFMIYTVKEPWLIQGHNVLSVSRFLFQQYRQKRP
jgi:calcineurin-like phosphoesterase family protein